MKKKVVLWLKSEHVDAILELAKKEHRTLSSAACALMDKGISGSGSDPVMVSLQQIQSQLVQMQRQLDSTFKQPAPAAQVVAKPIHTPAQPPAVKIKTTPTDDFTDFDFDKGDPAALPR